MTLMQEQLKHSELKEIHYCINANATEEFAEIININTGWTIESGTASVALALMS